MTVRYNNQTIMYDDTKDTPASHNATPLDDTPPTHSILELDSKTTAEYSEDIKASMDATLSDNPLPSQWIPPK